MSKAVNHIVMHYVFSYTFINHQLQKEWREVKQELQQILFDSDGKMIPLDHKARAKVKSIIKKFKERVREVKDRLIKQVLSYPSIVISDAQHPYVESSFMQPTELDIKINSNPVNKAIKELRGFV